MLFSDKNKVENYIYKCFLFCERVKIYLNLYSNLLTYAGRIHKKIRVVVTNGNRTNEGQEFEGDFVLYTFYIVSVV